MAKIYFIWNIQLPKNYGFFSALITISFLEIVLSCAQLKLMCSSFEFRSYYDKIDYFEQEEPRKNIEVDLNGFPSEK